MIGDIVKVDEQNKCFYIKVPYEKNIHHKRCKVSFISNGSITDKQRKKIYVLIRSIAEYTGYKLDISKMILKMLYMDEYTQEYFSLSDTSKQNATKFITFLIDYILKYDIPCNENLIIMTEEINYYLFKCLLEKTCCICRKKCELHHVDVVGLGRNRNKINHLGMRAIALCTQHHRQYHDIGGIEFNKKYHVYGIPISEEIAKKYKLKIKKDDEQV